MTAGYSAENKLDVHNHEHKNINWVDSARGTLGLIMSNSTTLLIGFLRIARECVQCKRRIVDNEQEEDDNDEE